MAIVEFQKFIDGYVFKGTLDDRCEMCVKLDLDSCTFVFLNKFLPLQIPDQVDQLRCLACLKGSHETYSCFSNANYLRTFLPEEVNKWLVMEEQRREAVQWRPWSAAPSTSTSTASQAPSSLALQDPTSTKSLQQTFSRTIKTPSRGLQYLSPGAASVNGLTPYNKRGKHSKPSARYRSTSVGPAPKKSRNALYPPSMPSSRPTAPSTPSVQLNPEDKEEIQALLDEIITCADGNDCSKASKKIDLLESYFEMVELIPAAKKTP